VIPCVTCHVTQRGNRGAQTFFEHADYALYRDLLAEGAMDETHLADAARYMSLNRLWCHAQ